jgi:hypothetical protein
MLARKVCGSHMGIWLLVPEHLRLGSWDLLKAWSGGEDITIKPRLAMQIVHEAAICVSGMRPVRSLCHQGFELCNGLPFIATDKAIHELLDEHTIAQSRELQIALGQLRYSVGHYNGKLLALDPHRIGAYTRRIMPAKKKNPHLRAQKVMQMFTCIDALSGQPVAFTLGSSATQVSKATNKLHEMMKLILPDKGLVVADTEYFTEEIMNLFLEDNQFTILVPMPYIKRIKRIVNKLEYNWQWPGYAITETNYKMNKVQNPVNMIVQRTSEIKSEYKYKAFATTGNGNALKMITEDYPERWTIEEFFNFESAMGWNRTSTMNLNIRYGKMSLALIAQAATHQLRQKLPKPYKIWTAQHLAHTLFRGMEGDIRVSYDRIIVTFYNAPENLNLRQNFEHLPEKLEAEGINPKVPWLYDFKIDFRFK